MRTFLAMLLCLALALPALAQVDEARAKQSDAIMLKIKQLDLMNHVLPLLMTKEQVKKLLPVVEKARQNVKKAQLKEADALKTFDAKLSAAHKNAVEKGQVPGRTLLNEVATLFQALTIARGIVADENTDDVIKAMREVLNPGQIKAAINDLNPKLFDPRLKPEEMSDNDKLRFFVKEIFLDPALYDVLVLLARGS